VLGVLGKLCADHGDMRLSRGRARFEAHSPPAARPLKRSPDLSRKLVTKGSAAHVKEQRPGERKLPNRVPSPESSVPSPDVADLLHFCWQTGHLWAISSTSQLVHCDCSRRSCTQAMPHSHTQLPYCIQTRARAMNGAAHRERWVGREGPSAPQSGHPSFSQFYGIATHHPL
jgi:hypothetical protein